MSEPNPQRRKVVVLAALVACLSAVAPTLMRYNRTLGLVWVCLMVVLLVYVIAQFGKAMREKNQ